MSKITISYDDIFNQHVAVFDGYCGEEDSTDKHGKGGSPAEAVRDLIEQTETCELDCAYYCLHCGEFFHDIKDELEMSHEYELPESIKTNAGDHICHSDCGA